MARAAVERNGDCCGSPQTTEHGAARRQTRCVVVRIPCGNELRYASAMIDSSLDLRFYALWCESLAEECQQKNIANELRQISDELTQRAQKNTLLKSNAA
jgi:hypothetical protein